MVALLMLAFLRLAQVAAREGGSQHRPVCFGFSFAKRAETASARFEISERPLFLKRSKRFSLGETRLMRGMP